MEYLYVALAAGASVAAFVGIFINLRKARIIEDTPTSRVRSAPQAYVELTGISKAAEEGPLNAPLTARECLWYDYRIERYRSSGKSSRWETVESGRSERLFALQDATGRCHIDPRHADISTAVRDRWYGHTRHPTGTDAGGVLRQLLGARYRYTEQRIHSDSPLYAIGLFQTIRAPSTDVQVRERMTALLAAWKQDQDRLIARFDRNGDGEIDQREWESARQEAAREARYNVLANGDDPPVHMLSRPPGHKPYLIATTDPEQLTGRYRRRALLMVTLFLVAATATVLTVLQLPGGRS